MQRLRGVTADTPPLALRRRQMQVPRLEEFVEQNIDDAIELFAALNPDYSLMGGHGRILTLAVAAKSAGGRVLSDGSDGLPSQPTLSPSVDQLSSEKNLDVLKQGILSNGLHRIREESGGSEGLLVIDVDDVPFLAEGH